MRRLKLFLLVAAVSTACRSAAERAPSPSRIPDSADAPAAAPAPSEIIPRPPAHSAGGGRNDSQWRAILRLPRAIATKSVVLANGVLYVISGSGANGPVADLSAYDMASRRWSARRPLPRPVYTEASAAIDGTVYIAGGCVRADCNNPTAEAYAYDPRRDEWSSIPALPEAVYDATGANIGGRFVVFGGVVERSASPRVYAYDPSNRSWSRLADMPRARALAAGAEFKGRFLIAGGCAGEGAGKFCDKITDSVDAYDAESDSWSSATPLPAPLFSHGAIAYGDRLLVAGGAIRSDVAPDNWTFLLSADGRRWSEGPRLQRARFGAQLFPLFKGGVGLFGPTATNNPSDLVEALGFRGPFIDPGFEPMDPPPAKDGRDFSGTTKLGPVARVASVPREREELPPSAGSRENAHAIVIGVERYRERVPRAEFAAADARMTAEYFRRVLGVPDANLALLLDDRATKGDLEKYIEQWLPNRVEQDDEVFVYFSGHGAPSVKTSDAYLVPFDGDPSYIEQTGYPVKKLYEQLAALPAKRVVVLMDSCFSGTGGRSIVAKNARPLVSVRVAKVPSKLIVLSASAGDQISNGYQEKGHGLFTYFLLKGMRAKGGDFRAVFDYLKKEVPRVARREYNADQNPQWQEGR